jgi:hypothetical protein
MRGDRQADAVLSGYVLGSIVERQGWPAVFLTLAGVCIASLVAAWLYTREQENAPVAALAVARAAAPAAGLTDMPSHEEPDA